LASIEATPFPVADEDYRFQEERFLSIRRSCAATKSPTRVGFGRQWGKLTDDDLAVINGRRDQLEGKIQERYGNAKD
jgi:CsbD-like